MKRIVVGVTGASGIILAHRLISALAHHDYEIELVMSKFALYTASQELGSDFATPSRFVHRFAEPVQEKIRWHAIQDAAASIASGSYRTEGMAVVPCSMATAAALSIGLADNLLRRAADVTIKERRTLVIVPRETPLSTIHLENLLRLSRLGAAIIPPVPAWYQKQNNTLEGTEWYIVGKVLDAFGIEHNLYQEWLGSTYKKSSANSITLSSEDELGTLK